MYSSPHKKLGQLLCERSYLDSARLEFALDQQKSEYQKLGQLLLKLGYISHAQLNEALSLQVGVKKLTLRIYPSVLR